MLVAFAGRLLIFLAVHAAFIAVALYLVDAERTFEPQMVSQQEDGAEQPALSGT
jgi:hypothetical protein